MANQTKLALFFKTSSSNPPSSSLGKHPLNSSEDELEDSHDDAADEEDSHDDAADEDSHDEEDSHDDAADEEDSHDDAADEEGSHDDAADATSASGTRFQSMSKHKIGYNKQWEDEYPWLVCKDDGLYCHLCKRYNTRNERNGSSVFNQTPCISKRKDVLRRHASSSMHQLALRREHERLSSDSDGGIRQAFSNSLAAQRRAAIGAMKCLYWLAKNEIPHTTKYVPLIKLASNLGCTYFDSLHRGGNASYTSERIIQEFLRVLSSQIEASKLDEVHSSQYVGLMCDETTDISILKQLVIYGR